MEDEVKIKDSEEAQNSFVEKIKSNKNLMIICGVVVIILIIILISRGRKILSMKEDNQIIMTIS